MDASQLGEQLGVVVQFFVKTTQPGWQLADQLAVFYEESVLDLVRAQWFELVSRPALYSSLAPAPTEPPSGTPATLGAQDASSAMRRTKSGIVVSLLCIPRKKLRSCAEAAQKLLDAIVANEPDELVLTLARLVRPFVELSNPGVSVALDNPAFTNLVANIETLLSSHSIHFNPAVFRYLDPQITQRVRPSNPLSMASTSAPAFAIENTWLLQKHDLEQDYISRSVASMKLSNKYLFGPALNFKNGEALDDLLKARQERLAFWAEFDADKKVTPMSATFPAPGTANLVSSSGGTSTPAPIRKPPPKPPLKRLSASGPSNASVSGSASNTSVFGKKPLAAGLVRKSALKMIDADVIVKQEKELYEAKKRAEEEAANEAARKKREVEEKKQQAKEAKEREAEEKRVKRERAIEEKQRREAEVAARKEEERRRREEVRARREEEDLQDRDDKRRMSGGEGGMSYGEQPPLGYPQPQQGFHVSPQAGYTAPSPPQQYHPAQMQQVHPDRIQQLHFQDTEAWNSAQQQQGYYEQQQQSFVAPIVNEFPPVLDSVLAAAHTAATVQAESILGSDAAHLSAQDRALVEAFLSGHYDKTSGNKEIKLSESTVTDAGTDVTQVHTLYLVLDYEACKWKKIKRKRKV